MPVRALQKVGCRREVRYLRFSLVSLRRGAQLWSSDQGIPIAARHRTEGRYENPSLRPRPRESGETVYRTVPLCPFRQLRNQACSLSQKASLSLLHFRWVTSPDFQSRQRSEYKNNSHDPKPHYDPRFRPTLKLKMVMYRSHFKNPFAR